MVLVVGEVFQRCLSRPHQLHLCLPIPQRCAFGNITISVSIVGTEPAVSAHGGGRVLVVINGDSQKLGPGLGGDAVIHALELESGVEAWNFSLFRACFRVTFCLITGSTFRRLSSKIEVFVMKVLQELIFRSSCFL